MNEQSLNNYACFWNQKKLSAIAHSAPDDGHQDTSGYVRSWRGSWQACLFQVCSHWVTDAVEGFCPELGRVISYRTLQSPSCKDIMTRVWMRGYPLHAQKNAGVLYLTTKQREQGFPLSLLIVRSSSRLAVTPNNRETDERKVPRCFRLHRPNCLWCRIHSGNFQNKEWAETSSPRVRIKGKREAVHKCIKARPVHCCSLSLHRTSCQFLDYFSSHQLLNPTFILFGKHHKTDILRLKDNLQSRVHQLKHK